MAEPQGSMRVPTRLQLDEIAHVRAGPQVVLHAQAGEGGRVGATILHRSSATRASAGNAGSWWEDLSVVSERGGRRRAPPEARRGMLADFPFLIPKRHFSPQATNRQLGF